MFEFFVYSAVIGLVVFAVLYYIISSRPKSALEKQQKLNNNDRNCKVIPGWDQKPADSQMGDLVEMHKYGSMHEYLLHLHKNGHQPVIAFWWGQQRVVSICSPKTFKDTVKLTNRPKELMSLFEPVVGPQSILYANGEEWEDRRKWLYESLKGTSLESYIPMFVKIANETANTWSQLGGDNIVDVKEEFLTMTLKAITRTCYGSLYNDDEEVRKMSNIYQKIWSEMEQNVRIGLPTPGSDREKMFNEYSQQLRDVIQEVVEKRQSGEEQESVPFMDSLLQSGVPDEQIVSDGITFMLGGLHSSAYLLYWTIHYLMLNEDIYHKLVEEMKMQVGADRRDKLKQYVYDQNTLLRQILNEILRLTALSTYVARYSDDDIVAGGYHIPAGTPVVIALGVSLKNKTVWKYTER
ncbi:cytochrome P450 20A1-like isoform X2 [Dysidea avara]